MDKTLYIIIAVIVFAAGGYFYYATKNSNQNNNYSVEKVNSTGINADDCNYNFIIDVDFDKLRFKDHTTLNAKLRAGSVEVTNGMLNLSRQSLKLLPSEVAEQTCIKTINLNRNHIAEFPMALFDIDKLRKIDLSENQLTAFPSLEKESSLISLKLTGNNISSVSSADLLKFKNLEHLYFKENENLKDLPKEITQLTKLKNLDLRKTALAQDYGKIQKLQKAMPNTNVLYFSKK